METDASRPRDPWTRPHHTPFAGLARRYRAGAEGDRQFGTEAAPPARPTWPRRTPEPLAPPWSSDWIIPEGRRKLTEAGIAPPGPAPARPEGPVPLQLGPTRRTVSCPLCGSPDTEQGYVLTCQSLPVTDAVTVDFDA